MIRTSILLRSRLVQRTSINIHSKLPVISLLRFNSSTSFAYINDYDKLSQKVQETITPTTEPETIIEALKACKSLQINYPIQDQLDSNSKLTKESIQIVDEIFNHEVKFSPSLLKDILLLNLPTELNLKIINHYYRLNPGNTTIVNKETALVALRNALFNADFERAIKLTDITVGHPNYILKNHQIFKKGAIQLISTAVGITLFTKFGTHIIIDSGYLPPVFDHLASLNSIILTYLFNSTFFITIVKLGRQMVSSGGDYLAWQKGTFYTHWFKHADELLFSAKIVEADRDLNRGESNPEILNELCRPAPKNSQNETSLTPGYTRDGEKIRLLAAKDSLEDIKFQAYWMTGGDGFEWVEPDQDPADIKWKQHIDNYHAAGVDGTKNSGALKWADELIEKSDN
ncbi:uncharacterized protein J8A68_001828 [[Candida] subhashii]|uniref:Uncharacterized protein n=1 Tax=[Candida] subhashii TaxID=561895 RepID=A0A8J5UQD8_9ASCO|nr:uncharacterized protein J8A68_001828 [[Candida] subhashii]KAG7664666.1 hypothetical protein J8A68_001828 [[Candida] subhashii]